MIWDLHCHVSGVDGRTPDERITQLMEYADRMGGERMVFFMGLQWSQEPTPNDLRRQNDEVIQALSHWHDRTFGFAYVSPQHVDDSLAEIDRCVANGPLVGITLWVAQRCGDEAIEVIILRAAALKAAIFQHTWFKVNGNLPGESTPDDWAALAARHPDVPLIRGHPGGDRERGIRAIRSSPNVSIGTGGFDPTAGMMEMAVRELGPHRILYGSDVGGRSFASQLAKAQGADVPEDAKRLILGENLRRMRMPILRDKGIDAPAPLGAADDCRCGTGRRDGGDAAWV